MIAVKSHAQGALLPVFAKPGARADAIVEEYNGALRVSVIAPPEDGKANDAIVRVLAQGLGLHKSQITLMSGDSSRRKWFLVAGIGPVDLITRIDQALTPTVYDPSASDTPPPTGR